MKPKRPFNFLNGKILSRLKSDQLAESRRYHEKKMDTLSSELAHLTIPAPPKLELSLTSHKRVKWSDSLIDTQINVKDIYKKT